MNILTSLFRKNINRHIEGVVKADDIELAKLNQEVDEYVLTQSIEKKLEELLEAYSEKYSDGNGVWISGFFGSGKSHLLKMVALLLENKDLGGRTVVDAFIEKCSPENAFLKSRLKNLKTPAKSILFDIAKKANIDNKKDTVLEIFMNVFNEACGYYGKSRDIAQFERELDEEGLFETFKAEFKNIAKIDWEDGRVRQRYRPDIDKAYNKVHKTNNEYQDVLAKTKQVNATSIDSFAELVKAYIDKQGSNFRINFLADEVGQYIGNNVQYMLELQAITEKLGTLCKGRAAVIVTSQASVATFLEDMGATLSRDDFSKIQGRFRTRLHLDSQDVEEVIQKRLLEKQDDAKKVLSDLYHNEVNNFKTLFDFTEGQVLKNFKDEEHFIDCYPFIPYQFTLFQNAMQELSRHGAFQGGYTSVGARSILSVFQQVAINVSKNNQVGEIATFDMMYEGIRSSLASIQSSIAIAEKNLENPLAVKILKALFLVKYIKSFKATQRNIAVLMHSNFNENQVEYNKQIEEALNILEDQTYIQRTNDVYEYLTDKEKDIEEEIKKTDIAVTDIPEELQTLIYDSILRQNKIHHTNGTDYNFTRKLDGKAYSREYELSINVISPLDNEVNAGNVAMKSIENTTELFILLPEDKRLIDDLGLYKKTLKYINQTLGGGISDDARRIIQEKQIQNNERKNRLQERTAVLVGKSRFYVNGSEIEMSGSDAASCITKAFMELVDKTYTNIKMLAGVTYKEQEIDRIIQDGNVLMPANLSEPEQEVYNNIMRSGTYKATVKSVLDTFQKIPYGWSYAAVLCHIAKLYVRRKIEIKENSNILEDNDVIKAIKNTSKQDNLILQPTTSYSASQIRQLKDFYEQFCNEPISDNDAKTIASKVNEKIKAKLERVTELLYQKNNYPFVAVLSQVKDKLNKCTDKPYNWYFNEFTGISDELLSDNDNLTAPITNFMNGTMRGYYDDAKQFLADEKANLEHIKADAEHINNILNDLNCYKGTTIQDLRENIAHLQQQIASSLEQERNIALDEVSKLRTEAHNMEEWNKLDASAQQRFDKKYDDFAGSIKQQKIIPILRYTTDNFNKTTHLDIISQIAAANKPNTPDTPQEIIISAGSIAVKSNKTLLANAQDVEEYLANLKQAMLGEIKDGKKIKI